jgi:hypothetical protein
MAVIAGCGSSPAATATPSAAPTQGAVPTAASTATPVPAPIPTPAPTPTPAATVAPSGPAASISRLVGEDTATVYLTDWARIRGDRPVPADTAARFPLVRDLADRAASAYAVSHFRGHREAWGWDTLDLDWEATVQGDGPPLYILALGPDADLDAIMGAFRDRDFAADERPGAVVFSRTLDVSEGWIRTTELGIHNTAILAGPRLMILSSSGDDVNRAVDALAGGQPPASSSPAAGTRTSAFATAVGALGAVDAAIVELRPDMCSTIARPDDPDLGPVAARLHPWSALAAGWPGSSSSGTARLVFAYSEPGLAEADLDGRARLARDGSVNRQPIAERLFRLDDARTEGSLIVLDVSLLDGRPLGILSAFMQRDLVFAACG